MQTIARILLRGTQPKREPFAHPAQLAHAQARRGGERRIERAHHERARQAHAAQLRAEQPRLERLEIDGDVGKLGHPRGLSAG